MYQLQCSPPTANLDPLQNLKPCCQASSAAPASLMFSCGPDELTIPQSSAANSHYRVVSFLICRHLMESSLFLLPPVQSVQTTTRPRLDRLSTLQLTAHFHQRHLLEAVSIQ